MIQWNIIFRSSSNRFHKFVVESDTDRRAVWSCKSSIIAETTKVESQSLGTEDNPQTNHNHLFHFKTSDTPGVAFDSYEIHRNRELCCLE